MCVDTMSNSSECKDEVTKWVLSKLQQFDRKESSDSFGFMRVVCGEQYIDWEDEEDDNEDKAPWNRILYAVYMQDDISGGIRDDNLLWEPYKVSKDIVLSADRVSAAMSEGGCEAVRAVGVSAIADMRDFVEIWDQIIRKERDWCDGAGKGFMVHPMWYNYFEGDFKGQWLTMRERSFNFGWGRYRDGDPV